MAAGGGRQGQPTPGPPYVPPPAPGGRGRGAGGARHQLERAREGSEDRGVDLTSFTTKKTVSAGQRAPPQLHFRAGWTNIWETFPSLHSEQNMITFGESLSHFCDQIQNGYIKTKKHFPAQFFK